MKTSPKKNKSDSSQDTTPTAVPQETVPSPKRLTRSKSDKVIFGVAAGLAEYLSIDPVIVRLLFVLLAVSGGSGVLIYLVLGLIIPEQESVGKTTQEVISENGKNFETVIEDVAENVETAAKQKNTQTWIGVAIIILGCMLMGHNLGIFEIGRSFSIFVKSLWPLAIIAIGLLILAKGKNAK